jgi:hypothetical protein
VAQSEGPEFKPQYWKNKKSQLYQLRYKELHRGRDIKYRIPKYNSKND